MSRGQSPPPTAHAAPNPYRAERARLLRAFGAKLRAERERRHLSQEALAASTDVHRTHIGALESGLRDPSLTMLLILADGLEIPPGTLVEDLFVPQQRRAPTHSKRGRAG